MLYSPQLANAPRADLDLSLFWSVVLLLSIGLVMVYSSSIAMSEAEKMTGYRMYYFLQRHAIYLTLGAVVAFVAFQIPVAIWQKFSPALFIVGGLLLVLVLIPGIGKEVNGSLRWIGVGSINIQVSELAKLFTLVYVADYLRRRGAELQTADFRTSALAVALRR